MRLHFMLLDDSDHTIPPPLTATPYRGAAMLYALPSLPMRLDEPMPHSFAHPEIELLGRLFRWDGDGPPDIDVIVYSEHAPDVGAWAVRFALADLAALFRLARRR